MSTLASISLPSWLLETILNSIWQVPLIFAAAWIAARLARPTGPRMEHRIWVTALFLEVALPALHFSIATLIQQVAAILARIGSIGSTVDHAQVRVFTSPAVAAGSGLHLSMPLRLALVLGYSAVLFYFAGRLAWGLLKTYQIPRNGVPVSDTQHRAYPSLSQCTAHSILISADTAGPVTLGIARSTLLLPAGFLERVNSADLDAVLAHESAHIHRRDFAKNLFYELLSLPVVYHPALHFTMARLAESREMVCDETAARSGREVYARALLRLVAMLTQPASVRTLHAIGILDANIFERRIMNLTQSRMKLAPTRHVAIAAAITLLALATGISALALHTNVAPEEKSQNAKYLQVKPDSMKIVSQVQPVYPKAAKQARVEGAVVIGAVISKDGVPQKLKVISGPMDLQQSAIVAVSHWRWEPYLLNGEPVEVETTVNVIYALEK
jgi:TonB family protein